jgi:hypothetical protein
MSFSFWPKAAALALLLPVAALAQQARPLGPADPSAPVPAAGYVSAFANDRTAPDGQASPDKVWRAANQEVGPNGPHAGHVPMPGLKAQPPALQSSSVQPDPHAGHGAGHTMQGR